jgi:hypothetical protein
MESSTPLVMTVEIPQQAAAEVPNKTILPLNVDRSEEFANF